VRETWEDNELAETIDCSSNVVITSMVEVRKTPDAEEGKLTEVNFSKVQFGNRGNMSQSLISRALPRFETFKEEDTMLDIKKQIYKRIKWAFPEQHDDDEEWINTALHLQIKDNCPQQRLS
jgi:hypothetical protein